MRKFLALIMVIAMIASFAVVASAEGDTKTVTAKYTFDENKADAGLTEAGTEGALTYADGTVTFADGAWLESDLDLTGATSVTVTVKVKATGLTKTAWLFDISTEETHVYKSEHYLGALFDANAGLALVSESYNSADVDRPSNLNVGSIGDDFATVVFQFNADGTKSVKVGDAEAVVDEQDEGHDLAPANCIGENPVVKIGKANWGSGEYAAGVTIDEIEISAVVPASTPAQTGGATQEPTQTGGATQEPAQTGAPAETGKGPTAPKTGFATIALAIAAIGSGAYVVSKKH